jgi:hypothetical protein
MGAVEDAIARLKGINPGRPWAMVFEFADWDLAKVFVNRVGERFYIRGEAFHPCRAHILRCDRDCERRIEQLAQQFGGKFCGYKRVQSIHSLLVKAARDG